MTFADDMRAPVLRAAEKAAESAAFVDRANDAGGDAIGAAINALIQKLEETQRTLIVAIKQERDAATEVRPILQGSTGMVADSLEFIGRADEELADNLRKLERIKEETRNFTQIMQSFKESNRDAAGKLRGASGHLRGYASTL